MENNEKPSLTFDQSLQELERIVRTLEEGKIPLEQAIELYAEGHRLCQQCTGTLQEAQLKIEQIRATASSPSA